MTIEEFQAALERGDIDAAGEMLADNVVFRSPAVFAPYEGKAATMVLLKAVVERVPGLPLRAVVRGGARTGTRAGLRGEDRHPHHRGRGLPPAQLDWGWSTTSA